MQNEVNLLDWLFCMWKILVTPLKGFTFEGDHSFIRKLRTENNGKFQWKIEKQASENKIVFFFLHALKVHHIFQECWLQNISPSARKYKKITKKHVLRNTAILGSSRWWDNKLPHSSQKQSIWQCQISSCCVNDPYLIDRNIKPSIELVCNVAIMLSFKRFLAAGR